MLIQGFDWDKGNQVKNEQKHGVTSIECEEVFFNKPLVVSQADKHGGEEKRFSALGKTKEGRLLAIIFTMRKAKVRVISARPMSKQERIIYEKEE